MTAGSPSQSGGKQETSGWSSRISSSPDLSGHISEHLRIRECRKFGDELAKSAAGTTKVDNQVEVRTAEHKTNLATHKSHMSKSVFCIATTQGQAERIVERLQNDEFGYSEISVLFPDTSGACLAGGALGLLAGVGTVVIPGLGPLIAAGPVLAALDATTGGVIGGLVGLGIPQIEAKRYEEKLKKGNYLISAHAEAGDELDRARAIFKEVGGEDISSIKEASVATV